MVSGTASQEINFWLTFERALDLEGIEAQLRSDEVNIVMDCLRNAKRFHATVSFITDTGLKDATDQGKSGFQEMLKLLKFRPLSRFYKLEQKI